MPRFYFHVFNDIVALDTDGIDLPDLAAARAVAIEGARDLASEHVKEGHLNLNHYVEVTDDSGEKVLKITFRDALTIEG